MKITVVNGQAHKGNTYQLTHMLLEQLDCNEGDIKEFNVNGMGQCVGCTQCILKDEKVCPHRAQVEPIIEALDESDVIIFNSPNYCMGMSGQMKSFCDHMAYRWMSHRPNGTMRNKIGVAISTTAGTGASKTTKAICTQFTWWAVGRTYQLPFTVSAYKWEEISKKRIEKLQKKVKKLANKINHRVGHVRPCFKTRFFFGMMTIMHEKMAWSELETEHWRANGWIK